MNTYDSGTLTVNSSGEIQVDYLFDGGWFRGELAVFSLKGMESFNPGSTEFMLEAARRALSDSTRGHILIQDNLEGAKFSTNKGYEIDFNTDAKNYPGVKTFSLNPGDEVGLMLIQHNTVQNTFDNPGDVLKFGNLPIFSIPEANLLNGSKEKSKFFDIGGTGLITFEDMPNRQGDKEYNDNNDMILKLQGLDSHLLPLEDNIDNVRDWPNSDIADKIVDYQKSFVFDEEVFQVGESGQVMTDFLYDGGLYEGEVGIFSLEGMNSQDIGSESFIQEAINRAQSNTTQGHIVLKDVQEGAKFDTLLDWEKDFNTGDYHGKQTFQMNPGELFGLVLVPNGTLAESLTAHESIITKHPIFSMSQANYQNQIQFANVKTDAAGTIVGFEDNRLDRSINPDYNDIVMAIGGIEAPVGLSPIEDVISSAHNWLEQPLATDNILPYLNNSEQV